MTSQEHSSVPFTKQALPAIFNRYTPPFSYRTNLKTNTYSSSTKDSNSNQTHDLSVRRYIEHKFFTDFNNHNDQFDNMLIKNYPSYNNQYVWSNKQHILMTNIIIDTNNIGFIKCINTIEDAQLDFLTFTYDQLINDDIIKRISFSFQHRQKYLSQCNQPQHVTVTSEDQFVNTLNPSKSKHLKSEVMEFNLAYYSALS